MICAWKHNNVSNELIFLGITEQGELLPPGLLALHRVMWKILIIAWTRVEFENLPVAPKQIWNITFRRITVRARALYTEHTLSVRSARMHDRTPPKPYTINKWLTPLAECVDGGLHWHPEWVKLSYSYGVNLSSWEFTAGSEGEDPPPPSPQESDAPRDGKRRKQAFVKGGVQRQDGGTTAG